MTITINYDSFEIKNWEITPEGYMKLWINTGISGKDLDYGDRIEYINLDALTSKETVNSAIGKHLTFNHPPQAITSDNWKEFAIGSALQEYASDGDNVLMASMVYDSGIISGIKEGKYKYVSAGYSAVKEKPNADGKIEQKQRSYNHFAILDENHAPRAGKESVIKILGVPQSDSQDKKKEDSNFESKSKNGKNATNEKMNVGELIQLHTQYDSVLVDNGKAINYDLGDRDLKRQILGCYYPQEQINKLDDGNLDGFWINFELNKEIIEASASRTPRNQSNQDSGKTNRQKYIDAIEGKI
ncbi:MAG: hypothetical protein RLZZ574_2569 [Cyanobacteriota bacterium]|jgi:hypothetical protein